MKKEDKLEKGINDEKKGAKEEGRGNIVGRVRFERTTTGLKVRCSTD